MNISFVGVGGGGQAEAQLLSAMNHSSFEILHHSLYPLFSIYISFALAGTVCLQLFVYKTSLQLYISACPNT